MKLGFDLLLWTTHVTEAHWPIIEDLRATGYDGVEVPIFEGKVAEYATAGKRLADLGLGSTGVSIMMGGSAISPEKAVRAKALDHMKWLVDCTAAMGGELVCGPLHQPLGEFSGRGPTADEVAWCRDVHKEAAQYAAKAGVAISVEPLNRFECYFLNTMEQAASLVKRVDEPNYGYLFDTFHTNIEENSVFELIPATIHQINHVHISENNRGVPGAGHIPHRQIIATLKAAGYDSWMTIEAFGSALPDLAAATKVWRQLYPSETELYRKGFRLMRESWDLT